MANLTRFIIALIIIFAVIITTTTLIATMIINKKSHKAIGQSAKNTDKITDSLAILENALQRLSDELDDIISRNAISQKTIVKNTSTLALLGNNRDNILKDLKNLTVTAQQNKTRETAMQIRGSSNEERIKRLQPILFTIAQQLDGLTNETDERKVTLSRGKHTITMLHKNLDMIRENITKINNQITVTTDKINTLNQNEKKLHNLLSITINQYPHSS